MTRLVIVPDLVADMIEAAVDRAIDQNPDAARDRDYIYQVLLDYYDEHGVIPQFTLEKRKFEVRT
jgi:hypothetical protein